MATGRREPRPRWIGPPAPAPEDGSRSSREYTSRRPRHYLAVELAGSGEQVNVNDVVLVSSSDSKSGSSAASSLVQVREHSSHQQQR